MSKIFGFDDQEKYFWILKNEHKTKIGGTHKADIDVIRLWVAYLEMLATIQKLITDN